MLRAHTSAHQSDLIKMGLDNFLVVGDVYRRDTIDATHYPVFHQMEGVRIWPVSEGRDAIEELKSTLEGLCNALFPGSQIRWGVDHFPFTDPSLEVEVFCNDDWLEILGCGKIHPQVLENAGLTNMEGWAFGLG